MNAIICAADGCERAMRPNQPYTYREIIALEQVSRTGGSGNLKTKEYTGRMFCPDHGAGHPAETLFGAST